MGWPLIMSPNDIDLHQVKLALLREQKKELEESLYFFNGMPNHSFHFFRSRFSGIGQINFMV